MLLLFLFGFSFAAKPVQVQVISRHCDRTPFSTFTIPKFGVDITEYLNQTLGHLTLLGEYQCYHLGKDLKERYLTKGSDHFIDGINPVYQSQDYDLISTNYDRTLRSGYCVSLGLFPSNEGHELDVYPYGQPLPNGIQSVPYESVDGTYDKELVAFDERRCPKMKKNRDEFFDSKEGKEVLSQYANDIETIQIATGLNGSEYSTFPNFYYVWDYMIVLNNHGKLPSYMNQYWNISKSLADASFYYTFRKPMVGKLGSGVFLGTVVYNMETYLKKSDSIHFGEKEEKKENTIEEIPLGRSYFETTTSSNNNNNLPFQEFKRFIHFSAHDQTIAVILANLNLLEDYEALRSEISYGAALMFELWKEDDGEYFVKIVHKKSWEHDFVEYNLLSLGSESQYGALCSTNCSFFHFQMLMYSECVITQDEYCSQCNIETGVDNVCLQRNFDLEVQSKKDVESSLNSLRIFTIIISIFAVVFCILFLAVIPFCLVALFSKQLLKIKNSGNKEERKQLLESNEKNVYLK